MTILNSKHYAHRIRITTCLLLLGILCGCSRQVAIPTTPAAPIPENVQFDNPYQRQLQSSAQWHVVAEDLADQLIAPIKSKKLGDRPFYIYSQNKPSTFNRAFNDFLITTLVNKGIKVSNQKQGSRIINYKIQPVEYKSWRETVVNDNFNVTSLAAGLVVLRHIDDVVKGIGKDLSILATGLAADAVDLNTAPNFEIIITSSILDGSIYLSRTTDIYYANASDKHLYVPVPTQKASDVFNEPFYQMK
ncbi:hypothetical protein [Methylophilus aquaticus]|uniref:FlgO domain-containing protein n=1 Tax=Methylophilus aquaticus TaxID=1971610 RepID=A0ABT9JP73_9PROT|nr:hypothetical protein [Methylophilus aquaticus]MDP8566385.1 hypothetical protein [Methylophilus aquaticus]